MAEKVDKEKLIGHISSFTENPHPGTGKKIEGWRFDERLWPTPEELEALSFAPSFWDPTQSGLDETFFQSGIGDGDDLLILSVDEVLFSGTDVWAPIVHHGHFFIFDEEWFLYSDSFLTECFTASSVNASGQQFIDLSHDYKPTIPIQIRRYTFDATKGRPEIDLDFRKVVEFSTTVTEPEFVVDTTFKPPRLILNGQYNTAVCSGVTISVSGTAPIADLLAMEQAGVSDGTELQEFRLGFCPVDASEPFQVVSFETQSGVAEEWTILSGIQTFSSGNNAEVYADFDLGTILFGSFDTTASTGAGKRPTQGHRIGVCYTKGLCAFYEPIDTRDDITGTKADLNPVKSLSNTGFVQVTTTSQDPASITLTANLPQENPFLIDLGNNLGEIVATVRNIAGSTLEEQKVTFEIIAPQHGTFGTTQRTVDSVTDFNGEATTFFVSPPTVEDIGAYTQVVGHTASGTLVEVDGFSDPGTLEGTYLYKVENFDLALGIPEGDLPSYYTNYLAEEEVQVGITAFQAWEEDYRTENVLGKPKNYPPTDISTGKKTIILTTRVDAINPHTGAFDPFTLVPLFPEDIENIGTEDNPAIRLTYSGLLTLPGAGDVKSYFVAGEVLTKIRAFVVNQRTGKRIFSNTIELKITIPDSINGTFFADTLSDILTGLLTKAKNVELLTTAQILSTSGVYFQDYLNERKLISGMFDPSGIVSGFNAVYEDFEDWFLRTRRGDTEGLTTANFGLETITGTDAPGVIPLGFRLRSQGITAASILDQVTFFDPNDHLPSGYFNLSGIC